MSNNIRKLQRANTEPKAITVELSDLIQSSQSLGFLFNQPLPARFAFNLSKIVKAVQSEMQAYNETRSKLLQKYGTLPEGANEYQFAEGKLAEFEQEHADLLKAEITIPGEGPALSDLNGVTISAAQMASLAWLIRE